MRRMNDLCCAFYIFFYGKRFFEKYLQNISSGGALDTKLCTNCTSISS